MCLSISCPQLLFFFFRFFWKLFLFQTAFYLFEPVYVSMLLAGLHAYRKLELLLNMSSWLKGLIIIIIFQILISVKDVNFITKHFI